MSRAIDLDRLTRKPVRRDCPLCHGHQTLSIRRGDRVDVVAQCFRCHASFADLAVALKLPKASHAPRKRRPPIRVEQPDNVILQRGLELLQEELDRLAHYTPEDRAYFSGSGDVRHEMNEARMLRSLATTLGDCPMAWDFLEEAAQREQRARLLVLHLDAYLARQNDTLQALIAEMTR